MMSVHALSMFVWQDLSDVSAHDIHWIMIAVVVIAAILSGLMLCLLVAVVIAMTTVKRLETKVESVIDDAKKRTDPILARGTELFDDLAPKIRSISTNVEQISFTARAKVDEVGETLSHINRTVTDINNKTRVQADRVDGIVTEALATTQQVSQSVQHGIRVPIRQVAGVVAGVKAALETLSERSPFSSAGAQKKKPSGPYDL